jgi:hypothetical protein
MAPREKAEVVERHISQLLAANTVQELDMRALSILAHSLARIIAKDIQALRTPNMRRLAEGIATHACSIIRSSSSSSAPSQQSKKCMDLTQLIHGTAAASGLKYADSQPIRQLFDAVSLQLLHLLNDKTCSFNAKASIATLLTCVASLRRLAITMHTYACMVYIWYY